MRFDLAPLLAIRNRGGGEVGGGPGGLKVETAGDAVDVEALADEIKPGRDATFHGAEVNGRSPDATGGDEFIFVSRLAFRLEAGGLQGV